MASLPWERRREALSRVRLPLSILPREVDRALPPCSPFAVTSSTVSLSLSLFSLSYSALTTLAASQVCLRQDTPCLRAFALAVLTSKNALHPSMLMIPCPLSKCHISRQGFPDTLFKKKKKKKHDRPLLSAPFYLSSEHLAPRIVYTYTYISPHLYIIYARLFIASSLPPLSPPLGRQPRESKDSVHLQAQCSERRPSATTSGLRGGCTQRPALGCLGTGAAQGALLHLPLGLLGHAPPPGKLPWTPSVPSLLLHSLSPEELYLAWGRAVWL